MDNVPGGADGRARWTLWTDEQEKDQAYRDHGGDGDAPCHLPVGHGGRGARELDLSPSARVEGHPEPKRDTGSFQEYAGTICL